MLAKWALTGAACAGLAGAVVGLVIGIRVRPATAPFALFELGCPSAALGGLIGLTAGFIASAGRRLTHRRP